MVWESRAANRTESVDHHGLLNDALDQLIDGDFQERWEAVKHLAALGTVAIAPLTTLVMDDDLDWEVRWFATRALSTFGTKEALDTLIWLVQTTHESELIAIAAEALGHFGERGIQALVELLDHDQHRVTAIRALATIHHPDVLMPLLAACEDRNSAVREVAFAGLGTFRDPQVDTMLIRGTRDLAAGVRQAAIQHLGMRSYLLEQHNLVDVLLPGLWDLQPAVNQAAALALGRLGTETAIQSLAKVLQSPHTPARLQIQIVRSLGWNEKESALCPLIAAYRMVPLTVQIEIVHVFSQLRSRQLQHQAGQVLLTWLTELIPRPPASAELKQAIALALSQLQCHSAKPALQAMLHDDEPQNRLYAEAALRQLTGDL